MANELAKQAVKAEEAILGTRWCSNCQNSQPLKGGEWKVLGDGMRRRWKCGTCVKSFKARQAQGEQR